MREKEIEREREEKRGRERSVGAMCEFWFSCELKSLKQGENTRRKKEIDKVLTLISLLSSWTSVIILKEICKVLYLKFAHLEFMNLGFLD